MTGIPTTFNTRFKLPNHPGGMTGRPISQLVHKQGKLFEGFGSNTTETRLGLNYIALRVGFGWRRLMKGQKPIYNIDDETKRTLERDELGDLDQSLWPVGTDGDPLDPWARIGQIDLVRIEDGCRLIFETSAPSAVAEVEDLVQRICWLGRDKDPQASPIIVIDTRQVRNAKNQSWWIPTFCIIDWSEPGDPARAPAPETNPTPPPHLEMTPEIMPSPEVRHAVGGSPAAAPRPRLARGGYQEVKRPEALAPSLKDVLDDKIPS